MYGTALIAKIEIFHHSSSYHSLLGRAIFYAVHAIPTVEQTYARPVFKWLLEIASQGAAVAQPVTRRQVPRTEMVAFVVVGIALHTASTASAWQKCLIECLKCVVRFLNFFYYALKIYGSLA